MGMLFVRAKMQRAIVPEVQVLCRAVYRLKILEPFRWKGMMNDQPTVAIKPFRRSPQEFSSPLSRYEIDIPWPVVRTPSLRFGVCEQEKVGVDDGNRIFGRRSDERQRTAYVFKVLDCIRLVEDLGNRSCRFGTLKGKRRYELARLKFQKPVRLDCRRPCAPAESADPTEEADKHSSSNRSEDSFESG